MRYWQNSDQGEREPLYFVRECLSGHINIGDEAKQGRYSQTQKIEPLSSELRPKVGRPNHFNVQPCFAYEERLSRDAGEHRTTILDCLRICRIVTVVEGRSENIEARIEDACKYGHLGWYALFGLSAEIVLPKIYDKEIRLFAIWEPVEVMAGFLIAGAASDHLPQFDAGMDGLHKDKIDHFRHVNTCIEHVDGNC